MTYEMLFAASALVLIYFGSGSAHWEYDHSKGKEDWHIGSCESIKRQSPIALTSTGKCSPQLKPIKIEGLYTKLRNLVAVNNGHTLMVTGKDNTIGKVSVSIDGVKFNLKQFHFHWKGTNNGKQGSEHKMDGKFYDSEMHMVFADDDEKDGSKDRYAVLGFLISASSSQKNWNFDKVLRHTETLSSQDKVPGYKRKIEGFLQLSTLLEGVDSSKYYRYEGSLTTPPCSETVKWTVFKTPIIISRSQLEQFRQLPDVGKLNNYREAMQPTADNAIQFSCSG